MCGINGFIDFSKKLNSDDLQKDAAYLKHRGVDDSGFYFDKNKAYHLGLASHRLSIIDTSLNGHQPMMSDCKNFITVFNGTIYNFKELKTQLQNLGHHFNTECDTEVLLHSYMQWPDDFLNRMNGIFAFCIIDYKLQKATIARDKLGVKPIFYHYQNDTLSFASELKALKNHLQEKKINQKALLLFLKFGYFPNELSIFEDIYKLRPAEFIQINLENKEFKKSKFWEFPNKVAYKKITELPEIIRKTKDLLEKSVLSRMIADVPVGVLLSGGYDSATTAAILQKNQAFSPIQTFSIGFEDNQFNEALDAQKIALYLGTVHHEHYLTKVEAFKTIKNLGKIYDEPMGDSGAVALLSAANFASKKVKVLLSSEGGDELFAGYGHYRSTLKNYYIAKFIPHVQQSKYIHPKLPSLLKNQSLKSFYENSIAFFSDHEIELLTSSKTDVLPLNSAKDALNQLLDFDLQYYLPEDLLMKADRSMMFCGIENRDPFLDVELVSYLSTIHGNLKVHQHQNKYILKQITHQYIPKELLERPKKGFSIPIENWLKEDLKEFVEVNLLKPSVLYQWFNQDEIKQIVINFFKGKRGYYRKVWILLSLKLWADEHLD
ncbi:MAG: asparagine synthase (glutamine-hydrolyzing) [Sphingobacteriales bacterium]|nr:asparagine synthase (glutamine-hydrolyzing) [Sphingobacteriales bacterium]